MKDLNYLILEAINKYSDNIAFIDKGKTITFQQFYIDVSKTYKYLNEGRTLIKCDNKYYYIVGLTASLFKINMTFLSNSNSHLYDDYQFSNIIDDSFIENSLNRDEYELYQYQEFDNNLPAMVITSSGTTAIPKPVVLSHKAIYSNIVSGQKIYTFEPEWTVGSLLPLDHAFGIRTNFLGPFVEGVMVVFCYSLIEFFANLKNYRLGRITVSVSLFKNLKELVELEGKENICPNLRCIGVGGSKSDAKMIKEFAEKYDVLIMNGYGLTECTPYVAYTTQKYYKEGSEGYILDCHKVRISSDNEIIISGDSIMLNYLDQYEKGIIVDEIHTKDCGYIIDNYLFVTGRIDNLIVLPNGYKIQPEPFEEEICDKYDVKDCVLYYKEKDNLLCLDIVSSNDVLDKIKKDYEKIYLNVFLTDKVERNQLKINRKYYKER